jgi:hypothetical protein
VEGVTSIAFDLLSFSAIIVLVVMGLGIIASMMGIFNFAHGEFLLLGAYTVYLTSSLGYPVWLGMLIAPFSVALVGFLLERGVIRFFYADRDGAGQAPLQDEHVHRRGEEREVRGRRPQQGTGRSEGMLNLSEGGSAPLPIPPPEQRDCAGQAGARTVAMPHAVVVRPQSTDTRR